MILFSIPVHERPDVIVNQIENFTFFNPDCQIVLHVSGFMGKDDYRQLSHDMKRFPHVHINDTRLWSGHMDGTQMKMHVVNYLFAQKQGLQFSYFCINASNDMFVKYGVYDLIKNYDAGGYLWLETGGKWIQMEQARQDRLLKTIMKKQGLTQIYGAQVEGTFYRKEIMDAVIEWIQKDGFYEIPGIYAHGTWRLNNKLFRTIVHYAIRPILKGLLYAKEEIYFPTLSKKMAKNWLPYNYCYINWDNKLQITREDIDIIRAGKSAQLPYLLNREEVPDPEFFCVKRVDREINDPLRQYITSLQR